MKGKKLQTTVYFETAQHNALKALSDLTKVPFAVYVREGIDLVLKQHGFDGFVLREPVVIPSRNDDTLTDGMGRTVAVRKVG